MPRESSGVRTAVAPLWLVETTHTARWLFGLVALFLYSSVISAVRYWASWRGPFSGADRIGVIVRAVLPTAACLATGTYARRQSGKRHEGRKASDAGL